MNANANAISRAAVTGSASREVTRALVALLVRDLTCAAGAALITLVFGLTFLQATRYVW